jgi:prophage regulatory protein
MLKLKEVQKITGLSRSSIYSYIEKGVFPIQVKLGQRSVWPKVMVMMVRPAKRKQKAKPIN